MEGLLSKPIKYVIPRINNEIRLNCPDFFSNGWDIGFENKGFLRLVIRRNANPERMTTGNECEDKVGRGVVLSISPCLPLM